MSVHWQYDSSVRIHGELTLPDCSSGISTALAGQNRSAETTCANLTWIKSQGECACLVWDRAATRADNGVILRLLRVAPGQFREDDRQTVIAAAATAAIILACLARLASCTKTFFTQGRRDRC
jgi:hypothetical protein